MTRTVNLRTCLALYKKTFTHTFSIRKVIMNLSKYKGIIFDMDGVIINSEAYHFEGHRQAFQKYGHILTQELYDKHIRSRGRIAGYSSMLGEVSHELIREIGAYKDSIYREMIANADVIYQDTMQLIEACQKKEIKTAIGTASHDGHYVVKHQKLAPYFNAVVTGKDVKNNKPEPDIYLKCMTLLGISGKEALVIEDSESGVRAGLAAGADVLYINREDRPLSQDFKDRGVVEVFDLYGIEV